MQPLPTWAKDRIHVRIECRLDWKDRLRALVHGRVNLHVGIATDKVIERTETDTEVAVPRVLRTKPVAMEQVHEPL